MSTKPTTARTVKRVIDKFEISYNEIAVLCRALAESEDEPWVLMEFARSVRRDADVLFNRLHDLHGDMKSRETRP